VCDDGLVVELDERTPHVARVVGELDFATSPRLVEVVGPLAGSGAETVVDLSGVTFCDSSGLNALVRLHKAAAAAGGALVLAAVPARIAEIMAVVSLDQLFTVRDDAPAADGRGHVG
jgi:anti-sigma B factor antagonist